MTISPLKTFVLAHAIKIARDELLLKPCNIPYDEIFASNRDGDVGLVDIIINDGRFEELNDVAPQPNSSYEYFFQQDQPTKEDDIWRCNWTEVKEDIMKHNQHKNWRFPIADLAEEQKKESTRGAHI
ncbi:hypothetical protein HPP92_016489 [Vanilla planifolia]|uniref:Uncharacterized protein n=1 Tax=Vanilla planifolia TaxID=51239 RepID=A0A835QCB9_VANPL|nr:hypothetical protein HPP92_016489 [Vanilla planifolia]